MNNKGFSLVELLGVVVVLSVVLGIAVISVSSTIKTSKEKAEGLFAKSMDTAIQSYISTNRLSWSRSTSLGKFVKCNRIDDSGNCLDSDDVTALQKELFKVSGGKLRSDSSFDLHELIDDGHLKENDIVNPKNKKDCMDGSVLYAFVYKDEDNVYYYYLDLSKGTCDVSDDNKIVSNIPKNVCERLGSPYHWDDKRCIK
ncbi:MAG: prepilin-type N-terminal cleavage/methylation domain-containing protein [Bacilli bacterium]|nr:prepilin-type N-terminal cleavage/methylation domain-containing protein [Bacilli bacterium]